MTGPGFYPQPNEWTCGPFALKHALLALGRMVDVSQISTTAKTARVERDARVLHELLDLRRRERADPQVRGEQRFLVADRRRRADLVGAAAVVGRDRLARRLELLLLLAGQLRRVSHHRAVVEHAGTTVVGHLGQDVRLDVERA